MAWTLLQPAGLVPFDAVCGCAAVGSGRLIPGPLLPGRTICFIFVSLQLLLVAVLGSAVLYAQNYDQELLDRKSTRLNSSHTS